MKALVTGGAGFIGSHLTELLIAEGHSVTVIDNYSTGRPDNLKHLQGKGDLKVVNADINDVEKTAPLYEGMDWVFHLAALADIVPSMERPGDYHRANVDGTFQVLQNAAKSGVKKLVYAASSSCYGIPDVYPTPETAPARPQYPYALTKYVGEQYVMHWGQVYRLPVVSLRLFNVYGPRSRTSGTYGAVFGVFLAQKIQAKPYTVVGDGQQSRDFTFVADVAQAFYEAARSDVSGEMMNVGSGSHYTVNRLVQLLGGDVVHIPKRPGEPDKTFADTAKIRSRISWRPKWSFEDGVAEMIRNIEYWRQAPVWTPESIKHATESWFKYLK